MIGDIIFSFGVWPPEDEEVLEHGRCPDCEEWMDDCRCCVYCGFPECEDYECLELDDEE